MTKMRQFAKHSAVREPAGSRVDDGQTTGKIDGFKAARSRSTF